MLLKWSSVLVAALYVSNAWAEDVHYNMVNLQDAAQMQVSQNQLTVYLAVESKANAREAASRDNTLKLNRVLQEIQEQGLKGQLLNRSVNQQYEYTQQGQQSRGWMDVAQIQISGQDTAKINQLVAKVQADARLESQSYGLNDDVKRQYVLQVTHQALGNFKQQAEQITQSLGGKRYRIVELNVNDSSHYDMQPRMLMAAKANVMVESAPVAADLAGEAQIRVQVSGKIQIH